MKLIRYIREYQWSHIYAMIKNSQRESMICDKRADGKLVVITGATSGIGYLSAKEYASKGANLICINRNEAKSAQLQEEIIAQYGVSCECIIADLSELDEIHRVAQVLLHHPVAIDVLIFNAGVYLTRQERTRAGHDRVLAVHYLCTFIITHTLMRRLKTENKARIILVNSEGHRFAPWGLDLTNLNFEKGGYSGLRSYGNAKLAQLLSMIVFAQYFSNSRVTINAMHPGAVESDTGKENGVLYQWYKQRILSRFLKPAQISADALYYLGIVDELEGVSGKFFNLTTLEIPTPPALDEEVAQELWQLSLTLGKINVHD